MFGSGCQCSHRGRAIACIWWWKPLRWELLHANWLGGWPRLFDFWPTAANHQISLFLFALPFSYLSIYSPLFDLWYKSDLSPKLLVLVRQRPLWRRSAKVGIGAALRRPKLARGCHPTNHPRVFHYCHSPLLPGAPLLLRQDLIVKGDVQEFTLRRRSFLCWRLLITSFLLLIRNCILLNTRLSVLIYSFLLFGFATLGCLLLHLPAFSLLSLLLLKQIKHPVQAFCDV